MDHQEQELSRKVVIIRLLKVILGLSDEQRLALMNHLELMHVEAAEDGQRECQRETYRNYINYFKGDESYWGVSRNISSRGMFIETKDPLSIDELVTLNMPNADHSDIMNTEAKVVRSDEDGIGIEFLQAAES